MLGQEDNVPILEEMVIDIWPLVSSILYEDVMYCTIFISIRSLVASNVDSIGTSICWLAQQQSIRCRI